MNMAARTDIKRILKRYIKVRMYNYPNGLVHSSNSMLPLKALKISTKAWKKETFSYLNRLLSILPIKRKTVKTRPNVMKNLSISFFI